MSDKHAGPAQPLPEGAQVDVWTLRHSNSSASTDLPQSDILSIQELKRQARFVTPELRNRFRSRREMIRRTLSLYRPDIHASKWIFSHNDLGKPQIHSSLCNKDLYFNLSRTNGMTLLAVAGVDHMGIDVENTTIREPRSYLDIAERFFTPLETSKIKQGTDDEQIQHFFDYWTLKEAYIKAVGKGLSLGLDRFQFLLTPGKPIDIEFPEPAIDNANNWQFHQETFDQRFRVAIALKNTQGSQIICRPFNYHDLTR